MDASDLTSRPKQTAIAGTITRRPPSSVFHIFELPTEIRLRILAFVVTEPGAFIKPRVSIPRDGFYLRLPAIVKSSRQFRAEALPLYYEENVFLFNVDDVLETPLEQDLRFEKRLLGFGAWCAAAGHEHVLRMRNVVLSMNIFNGVILADDVHLLLRLRGRGMFELTVHPYVWCIPKLMFPGRELGLVCQQKHSMPDPVVEMVAQRLETNEHQGLLPGDLMDVCRATKENVSEVREARHLVDWGTIKLGLGGM